MQKTTRGVAHTLLLILFPVIVLGVGLFVCCRHRGFSVGKISSTLEYQESWEVDTPSQEERENLVQNVLSQPFYYLDAGQQCYAFVSEDQKYVLKFFKMHHLMPKKWLNYFPFSLLESYRFNHVDKKQQFLEVTFNSFKASYERLREETGLVYVHLNKTRFLKQKIRLVDKNGKQFEIDLDAKEFVLQRKAKQLYLHLLELLQSNEDQRVHQCVRSFLNLIVSRCRAGFADQGMGVRHNYGFIDDQAVMIDCGQLVPDDSLTFPHNYQREILRIMKAMDQWAQRNCAELIPIIQEETQNLINVINQPDQSSINKVVGFNEHEPTF